MKKLIYTFLSLMILCACSGTGKQGADTDSVASASEFTAVDTVSREATHYISKDSVGSIWIGMSVNEVHDSVPGLYIKKENGTTPDAVTMVFSTEKGESFIAYDFGESKVDVINLISDEIKVKAPRGDFSIGDSFENVLNLPGVTAEWAGYDDSGMWYWTWEGLWFAPSQENLPEALSHRLYQSNSAPTPADFTPEVTVGFIGTGLPF